MMFMTVALVKFDSKSWDVKVDGKVIGRGIKSNKLGGTYEMKMPNGNTINACTQQTFKNMIKKELAR
jgi:hypothetical protein